MDQQIPIVIDDMGPWRMVEHRGRLTLRVLNTCLYPGF